MRKYAIAAITLLACSGFAQVKTWTTTADFNEGVYFNTNATAVNGEIRLNQFGTAPLPYINIPAAGDRLTAYGWPSTPGKLMRVNTETGEIVGEYRLTPEGIASAPSRAIVDRFGNCWVTNRYDQYGSYAITKVGVLVGGTRFSKLAEGFYMPDILGEYVKDPIYTTGVDRDGDGYIRTSTGRFGNLLGWVATAGMDLDSSLPLDAPGTVQQAQDELILIYKRYANNGDARSRAIAVDDDNHVWIGFQSAQPAVHQLDADDGHVRKTYQNVRASYGMHYHNGKLWGSFYDADPSVTDVATGATRNINITERRLAMWAPMPDGNIAVSHNNNAGVSRISILDANTETLIRAIYTPGSTDLRGITVGQDGSIWVASRAYVTGGTERVYRFKPDGTLISSFYTGIRPCGLGLDSNGRVWVTHLGVAWATVIDPNAAGGLGAIHGYVYLGTGSYNYSDGTGASTTQSNREGEWRVTLDSFRPALHWGRISWDATVPAMTSMKVFARASATRLGLSSESFVEANASGFNLYGLVQGRYVEVLVRMARDVGAPTTLTPALKSLTLRYADGTISGTVGLGEYSVDGPAQTADFALVPAGGGSPKLVNNVPLGPFGAYAFTVPERGPFSLYAKSPHWLRQKLPYNINITNDGSHNNPFALINGDTDGDNVVTLLDYDIFSEHFDKTFSDPNWNTPGITGFSPAQADLDGSYTVDLLDYDIFSNHFDTLGDEY